MTPENLPPPLPPLAFHAVVPPAARRAGFWVRAVAWWIDACIGSVVGWVVSFGTMLALYAAGAPEGVTDRIGGVVMVGTYLGYTTFELFKAATPGKMALRLVIATAGGGPADGWTLALRWSTKHAPLLLLLAYHATSNVLVGFLSGVMYYAVGIGFLQALDEHKRAWHDEWARTAVVRRAGPRV